jgi:hypothetical protein
MYAASMMCTHVYSEKLRQEGHGLDTVDASKSSKRMYLFLQCYHTPFGTISIYPSLNQLYIHVLDQACKPPQPTRQHMSYGTMCPQDTVDI